MKARPRGGRLPPLLYQYPQTLDRLTTPNTECRGDTDSQFLEGSMFALSGLMASEGNEKEDANTDTQ